jgi:hypothetical protein
VSWASINRAWGGKQDDLTVDTIYVEFELADGSGFRVIEDLDGWRDFLQAAQRELPGFPDPGLWLAEVMQPPFAPNFRLLFERRPSGDPSAPEGASG